MIRVAFYQLVVLALLCASAYALALPSVALAGVPAEMRHFGLCVASGGFGGVLYCIRGIYLNASAKGRWDDTWLPWYLLRPIASMICGGVAWLLLSAGLFVLRAEVAEGSSQLGFYAFSFLAGLNVDKFVGRIEEVAKSTFGIEKSRTSADGGRDQGA